MTQPDPLASASGMVEAARLELEAKGYGPMAVDTALTQALDDAQFFAGPLSEAIKERGMLDFLRAQLRGIEGRMPPAGVAEAP